MNKLPEEARKKLRLDELVQVDVTGISRKLEFVGATLVVMNHKSEQRKSSHYLLRNDPYTVILEECLDVYAQSSVPEKATHYYVGPQAREERIHQEHKPYNVTRDYVPLVFFQKK